MRITRTINQTICIILLLILLSACTNGRPTTRTQSADSANDSAFAHRDRLGRGINLGNALEAPSEGEWGIYIEDEYFPIISKAGFDSVRIPIKWSSHSLDEAPYTIDEEFFERIDTLVNLAIENDLAVVINIHHFDEMMVDPQGTEARFLALWSQIAERYQEYPELLFFEILNEPHNQLVDSVWNRQWQAAFEVIRASNPTRPVIIGPTNWNSIDELGSLKIPEDVSNLIATFHYYSPFEFTHQGAEWSDNSAEWLGTEWVGSESEMRSIRRDFDSAQKWSERNNVPVYMGEFGAYERADMPSRQRWTTFMVAEAEARGFAFAYWEFAAGFGAYDKSSAEWVPELFGALIQE